MKYKTVELEGLLLDAAVAKACGMNVVIVDGVPYMDYHHGGENMLEEQPPAYGSEWCVGGPLIDRERIATYYEKYPIRGDESWVAGFNLDIEQGHDWGGETGADASTLSLDHARVGPTPLVAAMRSYCASVFGEEVEL